MQTYIIVIKLAQITNKTKFLYQFFKILYMTNILHSYLCVLFLASICFSSASVWIIITTAIAHYFGRKKSVLLLSLNTFVASMILYFASKAVHVLISQFLHGITTASQLTILMMVITEYSSAKYRGIFLTLKSATFFWGIWTANAIGIFTHFKYIGLLGMTCSSYNFITSFFIPESPYWLAFKGRYDDCAKAHRWLKGVSASTEKELEDLINSQQERHKSTKQKKSLQVILRNYVSLLRQPELYKPISISLLVFLAYHMSGKLVCAVYAIEILKKITNDESTAHIGVLVLDGFSVLGMYVGAYLSKIIKRRTLFLWSLTIGTLFLLSVSLYLYLVKISVVSDNPHITILLLVGFSLAICCGPMILSTTISSELMPMKSRSFSICVFGTLCKILTGIILKTSPYIFKACGVHGTFLVFGIGSAVTSFLIYRFVPETKDKTLHEIATLFDSRRPIDSTEISPINKDLK